MNESVYAVDVCVTCASLNVISIFIRFPICRGKIAKRKYSLWNGIFFFSSIRVRSFAQCLSLLHSFYYNLVVALASCRWTGRQRHSFALCCTFTSTHVRAPSASLGRRYVIFAVCRYVTHKHTHACIASSTTAIIIEMLTRFYFSIFRGLWRHCHCVVEDPLFVAIFQHVFFWHPKATQTHAPVMVARMTRTVLSRTSLSSFIGRMSNFMHRIVNTWAYFLFLLIVSMPFMKYVHQVSAANTQKVCVCVCVLNGAFAARSPKLIWLLFIYHMFIVSFHKQNERWASPESCRRYILCAKHTI